MDKTCTKCGKKLRADNSKGLCGDWTACRKRASGGASSPPAAKAPKPRKSTAPADVVERFKTVANALGYDADELLEEYCEGWLADLKSKVDGAADDT